MRKQDFRTGSTRLYDDTAYKALNNIEREENRTGELWEIEMTNGMIKEAIILSENGNICQVIILTDNWNDYCDIEVKCRGERYGSSRMLQYAFNDRIISYIRTLTDEEFEDIQRKVADSLGLLEDVDDDEQFVPAEIVQVNEPKLELELERTEAQLEVYKNLYLDLLQMNLKGAV